MNATNQRLGEDWLSVVIGVLVFTLALALIAGHDLLGWAAGPRMWIGFDKSFAPVSRAYGQVSPWMALLGTYAATLIVLSLGAVLLGTNVARFAVSFTVVFVLAYLGWVIGNFAYIAATTPGQQQQFGIPWSLKLTGNPATSSLC